MSQLGGMAERCFDLDKPLVGKPAGRVCVTPFGEVRVVYRLLKAPVLMSAMRLAAVLRPEQFDDVPAFEREPVELHLPRDAFTPPNVALVMRAPVLVGPFRYGSQQVMPLTRRQRQDGVEVDVLYLSVADPVGLVEALRTVGVPSTGGLRAALAQSLIVASPEVAAEAMDLRRRRLRTAARKQVVFGVLTAVLVAARIAVESMPWETVGRLVAATLAGSCLVALAMAIRVPRVDAGRGRRWGPGLALAPIAVVVGLTVLARSQQLAGASYIIAWAAAGALLSGPLIGVGWRTVVATRPPAPTDPAISEPSRGWRSGAAASVAVAVLALSAWMEESAASLVRSARSALITEGDLPAGWEACCGGDRISRGGELDDHICGGDDGALPAHVAAVRRSFNKPTIDPAFLDAHLDETVLVAPTVDAARAEFGAVDSPGYLDCASSSVGVLARYWQSKATGPSEVQYRGRTRLLEVDGLVDSFRVRVPVEDGFDVAWVQFVRMRLGRAIVRMPVQSFAFAPIPQTELDAIVAEAIEAVEASDVR